MPSGAPHERETTQMNALMMVLLLMEPFTVEKVVAIVGDEPILHSQVETLLNEAGVMLTGDFTLDSGDPDYILAMDQLIEEQLVVQAAKDIGYYPTSSELQGLVDDELDRLRAEYSSDEFLYGYIQAMGGDPATMPSAEMESVRDYLAGEEFLEGFVMSAGLTMAEYRTFLADFLGDRQAAQTLIGYKVQAAMSRMPVSPVTYIAANPDLVEEVVMPRHVGWIYLPILPSGPDLDAAVAELSGIRSRIMAGESFEDLARTYSDDGSASNGGSLGEFGPGDMVPAFELAAYALQPGEVSPPVVTPFGVHLIRLDQVNDDGTIQASHILRLVPADQGDVISSLAAAEALRENIVSGELTFEEAAIFNSMDRSSALEGGDLGMVPLNLWIAPLANAARDLAPGEISDAELLQDAGAVVLIKRYEDTGDIDWSSYSSAELTGIMQEVIYQDTYGTLVDSLRMVVPVVINFQADAL